MNTLAVQYRLRIGRLGLRLALSACAVLLCYCLPWDGLRFLTSELNLRLDRLAGLSMQRLLYDTILWNGTVYRYVIACTFADVWCGALPLIWDGRRKFAANLLRSFLLGVLLLGVNALRLSFSDVLSAWGVPWLWAHGLVAGLWYYVVWEWVRQNCPEMSMNGNRLSAQAEQASC